MLKRPKVPIPSPIPIWTSDITLFAYLFACTSQATRPNRAQNEHLGTVVGHPSDVEEANGFLISSPISVWTSAATLLHILLHVKVKQQDPKGLKMNT